MITGDKMNIHGKKNIAFFGCSFTSGHELIDHELLQVSFEECNDMKRKHIKSGKSFGEFDAFIKERAGITNDQYNHLSSKRSYAGKLADKLGLNHKNYAEPGLSVEHSALKFFNAFYSGELKPETDVIFFGLTTPHRYLYFTDDGLALTRVMSHLDFQDADVFHTDYKIIQSYYFSVQNVMNFCIKHSFEFVIQPIVNWGLLYPDIVSSNYERFLNLNRNWQYLPMFRKMLDEFLSHSIDESLNLMSKYLRAAHGICGFNHPPEIAHDMFSEALYDKIITKQN